MICLRKLVAEIICGDICCLSKFRFLNAAVRLGRSIRGDLALITSRIRMSGQAMTAFKQS